ncbi:MAG: ABC transporter permease [Tissierellia bacterium]|nr:ABC transporter permease [Tissierellia bacterium]
MVQSFKFTLKSLKNTKGFLTSMTIMPIIMIILVSITLAYSNLPMVAVVGDASNLDYVSGIRTQTIEKSEIEYFLGSNQGTLIVEISGNGSIEKYYSSVENNPLISHIESQFGKAIGEKTVDRPRIEYSIGIIIFKLLTGASLLATVLIREKQNGIFVRIKNASISPYMHIIGKTLAILFVYEIANIVILAFYKFANFDFGNSDLFQMFLLLNIAMFLSAGIYIFVASIADNEGLLWVVSTGIFFPLALASGVLFPIKYMPNWMKTIAHISPQYYLQKSFVDGKLWILPIAIMLFLAFVLMILGIKNIIRER